MTPTLLAAALLAGAAPSHAGAAIVTPGTLARPEGERHYLLARPAQGSAGKLPLVIVLHGHSATSATTLDPLKVHDPASVWVDLAEREHLLVLAPDGWKGGDGKQGWNDCRADAPTNPQTDDVAFLGALIDMAVAEHNADPARVYVSGASNGGGMAYRAAIEIAPRLAAVAVSSALMPARSQCPAPRTALPMLFMHGTGDKIAPYAGGTVGHWLLRGRGSGLGLDASVRLWRELARLPDTPRVTLLPHRLAADPTTATRYVWDGGGDGQRLRIELLKIDGGGHVQPSIAQRLPWLLRQLLGEQNGDVEFAEESWAFFRDRRAEPAGK